MAAVSSPLSKLTIQATLPAAVSYELLPLGVLVLRHALTDKEQMALLEDTLTKLTMQKAMHCVAMAGTPSPSKGFCYRYRSQYPDALGDVEPMCIGLATRLYAKYCSEKAEELKTQRETETLYSCQLPLTFTARTLWGRAYDADQKLGYHVDPPGDDYVFIISMGRSVDVSYYLTDPLAARTLTLNSGDAVFFNGSILSHGISKIGDANTMPAYWSNKDFVRLGLQMRQ